MSKSKFHTVYLLHGRGGWPGGTVLKLQEKLQGVFPGVRFVRPSLPHGREQGQQAAEVSVAFLADLALEPGSLVIGISLGGLVAAMLQEMSREDLHVICISSPTWADGVTLQRRMPNRLALYSSQDQIIAGRTSGWPALAEAYDMPWLSHDTDVHKEELAQIIVPRM